MKEEKTISPSVRGTKGESRTGRQKPTFTKQAIKKRGLISNGRSLPYNPNNRSKAKALRRRQTVHEDLIWKRIRKQDFRALRQHPVDHYIVDFYIAAAGLVIEIDGDYHLTEHVILYDKQRTDLLEIYGLKVIRFTNDEVVEKFDQVCQQILDKVQERK